jgi:hypothetical protein
MAPYRVNKESHLDLKQDILRKIHQLGLQFADVQDLRPWLQRTFGRCEKMDGDSLRDFARTVLRQLVTERSYSTTQQNAADGRPMSQAVRSPENVELTGIDIDLTRPPIGIYAGEKAADVAADIAEDHFNFSNLDLDDLPANTLQHLEASAICATQH